MTTRKTSDNLLQLEQLAFDAGIAFITKYVNNNMSDTSKIEFMNVLPDAFVRELDLENWRQLVIVRSLEAQVMKGE